MGDDDDFVHVEQMNNAVDEGEDFVLPELKYSREFYEARNSDYLSGRKKINIHATCVVFKVVVKILREMIIQMN